MNLPSAVKLTQEPLHSGIAILNRRSTSSHSENPPKVGRLRERSCRKPFPAIPMQSYHQLDVDDGLMLHNKRRNQLQEKTMQDIRTPNAPFVLEYFFGIRRLSAVTYVNRQDVEKCVYSEG
ncbi:hypothetical protein F4678DRAFT_441654 [Xylaria arbuscula]|nr:hypothetical protein F4678DRAFT_441654 [Xylaria arbuscula]